MIQITIESRNNQTKKEKNRGKSRSKCQSARKPESPYLFLFLPWLAPYSS